MATGGFPPLNPHEDPGDPGPTNKFEGSYTGRTFPEYGDSNGDYGELQILRLEGVSKALPKRPFEIRKSVETFLRTKIVDARPENRGASYIIKMRNQKLIDTIKTMTKLIDGTEIKINDHPTLNQCRCVVYCPETTSYNTEEIKKELQDQRVKDVRRITKKEGDMVVPTPTLILTLSGTVVPQTINFGWIRVRTRPYYPTPMLCYGCYDYGHPRKRCPIEIPVCGICCGNHPITPETPCKANPYCKHCSSNSHAVSSRKCPVYMKEFEIQHLMVDQGIGYPAARRMYDSSHRTKTTAAVVTESNDARFAELNTKFERLLSETMKKDQQIKLLQQEATKRDKKMDALITAMKAKFKQIAEKDARIAELEAVLNATNTLTSTPKIITASKKQSTPTTKESKKELVSIEKTSTSNITSNLITSNRRSRSRSSQRSNSQKRGKEGRRTDENSNAERPPELASCNNGTTQNNSSFNKPAPKKHKKCTSPTADQAIQISDEEAENSQSVRDFSMDFNVSSDDPEDDETREHMEILP